MLWIVWLVLAILIAVWLYKDANARGRDGAIWGILGFLFTILTVIIWLIVRPKDNQGVTFRDSSAGIVDDVKNVKNKVVE